MLYYRYRPMTPLSIKELLYDELYFSYPNELNDPLDGVINFELAEDFPKWKRLLDFAWKGLNIDTAPIAEILAKNAPLSVNKLANTPDLLFKILSTGVNEPQKNVAFFLSEKLKQYIAAYSPTEGCSVSFSRTYENTLMWSHYTGKHEGFCLIFRSLEGCINQCPSRYKTSIKLAEGASQGISKNFKLHDVIYGTKKCVDGFTLFPYGVYGREMSKEEHTLYWEDMEKIYLTKSSCWDYEQESRLYIPASSVLSSIDRIYHYDHSQIAGVIYGMRMSDSNKKLIREILLRKSKERHLSFENDKFLFNIVSFESRFDDNQHTISIEPSEIFDCGTSIKNSAPEFAAKFASWTSGEALHIQKTETGSSSRVVTLD